MDKTLVAFMIKSLQAGVSFNLSCLLDDSSPLYENMHRKMYKNSLFIKNYILHLCLEYYNM